MANLIATDPVDMTDWNFGNVKTGTVLTDTAFKYTIEGADGQSFYHFSGVGLTYNAQHQLTGGVVTGYEVTDASGNVELSVSGFDLNATTLESAIKTGDASGVFENTVFANNNTITGSSGDDVLQAFSDGFETLSGGDGNDTIIDETTGGLGDVSGDAISGGNGDDTIFLGSGLVDDFPTIDGGTGFDTVILDGKLQAHFNFSSAEVTNIEELLLLGSSHYDITAAAGLVASGANLLIDGSHILGGAKASLVFDGSAETDGSFEIIGTQGSDVLRGGGGDDTFRLSKGGSDVASGGAGNDLFLMGASLDASDRIDGVTGTDGMTLNGDYSAGIVLQAHTIQNIDDLTLRGGHSYKITMNDANVAAGATLVIVSDTLGATDTLTFNGAAEKDGDFAFIAGAGNDILTGGAQADLFIMIDGGTKTIAGGGGDDAIIFEGQGTFTSAQKIDGGTGSDTLNLHGDYSAGLTFGATSLVNIETVTVDDGYNYNFTLASNSIVAGHLLTINAVGGEVGNALSAPFHLDVDGSATAGRLSLAGGDGDDTLIGGKRADTLAGGLGADSLNGGAGVNTFVYNSVAESIGTSFDTITGFNAVRDNFSIGHVPGAIDGAITTGALFANGVDAGLTKAVDAAHLLAGDAVLFTPDSGSFVGDSFLIVDMNGVAGYQAGADLVIDLHSAKSLDITIGNFS